MRSFHRLTSFYKWFVKDFNSITAFLNELVKKDLKFIWTNKQAEAFTLFKEKLGTAPILALPSFDISMNFLLGVLRTRRGRDNVFVVVDKFSKMTHFIACHKIDDATNITNSFLKDVRLHGIPIIIINDRDVKFLSNFWCVLWNKLRTKLLFFTAYHHK